MRIAIIGAGIAGLACAGALATAGHAVTLFDKGRRPGGRVATRRATAPELGPLRFNHGAQYATARGDGFRAALAAMREAGAAATWEAAGGTRWVGVPGMSTLPGRLAEQLGGVALRPGRHVAFLRAAAAGWTLHHLPADAARPGLVEERGDAEAFDAVLLATPHAQAAPLLRVAGHAGFADAVESVVVAPCWTAMLAFAAPVAAPDVQRLDAGPLAWIARENSRPGEAAGGPDRWVVNAAPEWSRARLEDAPERVAPDLAALFAAHTGATAAPAYAAAHRWRYALTERPLGEAALWDASRRIGACGDWCLDGRVEAAWDSGRALAARVAG